MNNLIDYLNHNKSMNFNDLLFYYIDKSGYRDSEIYKKADIDRKLFSKIRCSNNYIPRKKIIVKLCLALKLDKSNFNKLLNSAGYSLSSNNNFDLIIFFALSSHFRNTGYFDR